MNQIWKYETKKIEEVLNILNSMDFKGVTNADKLVKVFQLLGTPMQDEKETEISEK